MNFDIPVMIDTIWIVFQAVPRTFLLAAIILVLGIILGALLAFVKIKRLPIITTLVNIFVSYMRGVPLIVHLYVMMNFLPEAGTSLLSVFGVTMKPHEFPSFIIVVLTYSLLEAAVESENIRGAFQAIDPK